MNLKIRPEKVSWMHIKNGSEFFSGEWDMEWFLCAVPSFSSAGLSGTFHTETKSFGIQDRKFFLTKNEFSRLLLTFLKDYRCESGFAPLFQECKDIDECGQTINWCGHLNCINTIGSYFCQCSSGMETNKVFNVEYQRVETKCSDIDECRKRNICPQKAVCNNTEGTYSCLCKDGYDGDLCTDVDECSSGIASCGEKAQCLNTKGEDQ